eukprot:CAMPEP_0173112722 /NCGR_PEP_ID=MMETSP1102-20130122/46264_1 /TAXON_ID=49646 /ORGANISM="Geminigera sp., Strain Caron Lab Isolate" /LENGTH=253 /DNA_ID=CAMNT_0014014001 /DNA_START=128 /DNA_END=886 /DNA_ORIENTATION=+
MLPTPQQPQQAMLPARATRIEHQDTGLSALTDARYGNWLQDRPYRNALDLSALNMKPDMVKARLADNSKARLSPRIVDVSMSASFGSLGASYASNNTSLHSGSPGVTYIGANLTGLSPVRVQPEQAATTHGIKGRALTNPKPLSLTDRRWHPSLALTQHTASQPIAWLKKSQGACNVGSSPPGVNDRSTFDSYERGSDRPLIWGVPRERIGLVETHVSLHLQSSAQSLTQLKDESKLEAERMRRLKHVQMREW